MKRSCRAEMDVPVVAFWYDGYEREGEGEEEGGRGRESAWLSREWMKYKWTDNCRCRCLYEFECKLYHQHLGHRADAEDIHGDADLHGRTCNQQNHPALVAVITRQSLINRVWPIVYEISRYLETIVIITDNSGKDESTFTSDSRALYAAHCNLDPRLL